QNLLPLDCETFQLLAADCSVVPPSEPCLSSRSFGVLLLDELFQGAAVYPVEVGDPDSLPITETDQPMHGWWRDREHSGHGAGGQVVTLWHGLGPLQLHPHRSRSSSLGGLYSPSFTVTERGFKNLSTLQKMRQETERGGTRGEPLPLVNA